MTEDQTGLPTGYYYPPYVEGGQYEEALSNYFNQAATLVTQVAAVYSALIEGQWLNAGADLSSTGLSDITGPAAGWFGAQIGWAVDNFPVFEQNIGTAIEQANDASSWMSPDTGD